MAERTRVIIADDESIIRMDLREMLSNLGYLVVGEVGDVGVDVEGAVGRGEPGDAQAG